MRQETLDNLFGVSFILVEIVAFVFYGVYFVHTESWETTHMERLTSKLQLYPFFQDIHVMVFMGFGFLMTCFHKFKLSSLTNCFWVAALTVQYYFLFRAFWKGVIEDTFPGEIRAFGDNLILAEVSGAALLIAVCAVIGKVNNFQYLVITIIGVFLYSLNEVLVTSPKFINCKDGGGALLVHAFGAFYGIGVTWMLNYKDGVGSANLHETHESLTSAMLGTLFLWCYWPSANSALASGPADMNRAIMNTYFALLSSTLGAFFTSVFLGKKGKFYMSHILNATLAGGVALGSCADYLRKGYLAHISGFIMGVVTTLLVHYSGRFLRRIGIHDVAGVFNLHGVPGIYSGLFSAVIRKLDLDNKGGLQVAGTFVSVGIALFGGLIVGVTIKGFHHYTDKNHFFNDLTSVALEEADEEQLAIYGRKTSEDPQTIQNFASARNNGHTNPVLDKAALEIEKNIEHKPI